MAQKQREKHEDRKNFLIECQNNVKAIENYSGSDPLALWYEYLLWIEEHFVIDFKQETIFDLILSACLSTFEQDERYKQDRRLIKLFIKFIHFQDEQNMHYEIMLANGIGNKVADLYINWAFYFDMKGDFKRADQIFQHGIAAKAQPLELLQTAHKNFGYSMSQRMLYKSNVEFQQKQMEQMKKQLELIAALRIEGSSPVTVKSTALHTFDMAKLVNVCIPLYNTPQSAAEHNTSVTQNIMDSARKMRREKRSNGNLTGCRLDFTEGALDPMPKSKPHPSVQNSFEAGIKVGKNYPRKSLPQRNAPIKAYVDPSIGTYRKTMPGYDKIMLIPATNVAFSPEELKAYNWFKQREITNAFTEEYDKIWGVGYDVPIRYADVFARANFPQTELNYPRISQSLESFNENGPHKFMCNMNELYPKNADEEFQIEEIMWQKRKSGQRLTPKQSAPNRSLLKPGRIHNRTNSTDSKLSPIIEMDLSGQGDAISEEPPKGKSIRPVAEPKKRKSSIFPTFDALNDTCTTQMFSNLLHSTAISTPKVKMARFDEESERDNLPEETKLKLFIDKSDDLSTQKEVNAMNEEQNRPNGFKFAIFEDTTIVTREMKDSNPKNPIGDSFIVNKENVFVGENPMNSEHSKATSGKIDVKAAEPNSTAPNIQRKDEDVKESTTQNTMKSNAFGFDIYTDKTNETLKALENSRKILTLDQSSISNKENQPSKTANLYEKDVTKLNEMITSILNATKQDKNVTNNQSVLKEPNMNISRKEIDAAKKPNQTTFLDSLVNSKEQKKDEITVNKVELKPTNTQNISTLQSNAFNIYTDKITEEAMENSRKILTFFDSPSNSKYNEHSKTSKSYEKSVAEVNKMITSVLNATKPDQSAINNQSIFKEPSIMNLSSKKTDAAKKPNQTTFFEIFETTEEFEALEAQCADSPPVTGGLPPSVTPIKRIDQSLAKIWTPNKSTNNKSLINKSIYINWPLQRSIAMPKEPSILEYDEEDNDENDVEDIGKSIYVKQPELEFNEKDADWGEVTLFLADGTATNEYKVEEVNLNETRQRIDTHMLNLKNLDPFDPEVQKDILNDIGFLDQLNGANNFNCFMMNIVQPLKPRASVEFNKRKYQVRKLIGTGAFGKVFSAECTKTKEMYAFKQQRPPNLWEYYVCLQIHTRIRDESVRNGFMAVDFAVIGNNATIFASKFSKYGTILNVCNEVKQSTNKNIEECIVMLLVKQMFTIMEHFHKANFIHADIKPDNFLLMDKLCLNYENPDIVLQLIDFGQSIDLNYFSNHVFWANVKTENFICTEMMNDKPWTFHCDLFCLASTIYTMVAGKYMVVSRQTPADPYKPQKLPRYVNATLWDEIFDTLINIPSLKKMPSLSRLQGLIDAELQAIGSKKLTEAIVKFNKALD